MASSSNVSIDESYGDTTNSSIIPNQNGFNNSDTVDRFGFIGSKDPNL